MYGRVQTSPVAVKNVVCRSRFQLLAIDWHLFCLILLHLDLTMRHI